jgi:hypothetical protein
MYNISGRGIYKDVFAMPVTQAHDMPHLPAVHILSPQVTQHA